MFADSTRDDQQAQSTEVLKSPSHFKEDAKTLEQWKNFKTSTKTSLGDKGIESSLGEKYLGYWWMKSWT